MWIYRPSVVLLLFMTVFSAGLPVDRRTTIRLATDESKFRDYVDIFCNYLGDFISSFGVGPRQLDPRVRVSSYNSVYGNLLTISSSISSIPALEEVEMDFDQDCFGKYLFWLFFFVLKKLFLENFFVF